MEDPAGACADAAEEPDHGIWQPASSTAAPAAQHAAIPARPLLRGRAGQRPAGITFIAPRAPYSRFWQFRTACSGRAYPDLRLRLSKRPKLPTLRSSRRFTGAGWRTARPVTVVGAVVANGRQGGRSTMAFELLTRTVELGPPVG